MRQRAAAGPTPPRSGDSDAGNWQLTNSNNRMNQPRQRHHKSSGSRDNYEMLEEPRSVSMRDVHMDGDNGEDVGVSVLAGAIDAAATTSMDGPTARRRRPSGHPAGGAGLGGGAGGSHHPYQQHHNYQKDETHRLRHSPQHYLDEYNKNYNIDAHATTTTTTAGPSATAPHSASGRYTTTASEIYYAQYDSHYNHQNLHRHYDSTRPPGGVIMHRSSSTPNAHKLSFQHFESSFHMDPNPLAAVHFRKALHVPDRNYREFLHGKGRDTTPVFHPICCANVCAGFSFVGFIFMMFIGILLDTQPLFIGGTLPSALKENDSGKTSTIYFVTAERLPAATHAYQTSYAYVVTMLACLIYAYYERLNSMVKRRSYQDVPDATSAVGSSASNVGIVGAASGDGGVGGAGGVLPDYHHDGGETQAYQMSTWNRLVSATNVKLREWAATATSRVWNGRANYTKRNTRKKTCAKTI